MVILVLALTDQFGQGGTSGGSREAHQLAETLTDSYQTHLLRGHCPRAQGEDPTGRDGSRFCLRRLP